MTCHWQAISAMGTVAAVFVALGLGIWPNWRDRVRRKKRAKILRLQLLTQYSQVKEALQKRIATPYAYEFDWAADSLYLLWSQADLLEEDEFESVARSVGRVFSLRNSTLTKAEAEPLLELIEQASTVLTRHLISRSTS